MRNLVNLLILPFVISCTDNINSQISEVPIQAMGYSVKVDETMREDAFRRAKVWMEPEVKIESFDFLEGDQDVQKLTMSDEISCRWSFKEVQNGATPKFRCKSEDGQDHKVKYAKKTKNNNPEIPAEVASTRLLRALGFGADYMYMPKLVRCWGCPEDPWSYSSQMHSPFEQVRRDFFTIYGERDENGNYFYAPNFEEYTDFTFTAVEYKFGHNAIELKNKEGWKWEELRKISNSDGGASRAEVDALILLAVFIQHSDNKAEQQRLVCLTPLAANGYCAAPMVMINDVGATLGGKYKSFLPQHDKFNYEGWEKVSVWKDSSQCIVHIKDAPIGTFEETQISEAGRLFLASLLNRLSDQQIYDLFKGARAHEYRNNGEQELNNWVRVFKLKRSEIVNHVCP